MGYNTAGTKWPLSTVISLETKSLIDKLFRTLDDDTSGAGQVLANEIFTSDGIMHAASGEVKGTEAISRVRDQAWTTIKKRRHEIERVYAFDAEGLDLMLIGSVMMGFGGEGKELTSEFTARIVLESQKIKLYTVWADTGPMMRMIQAVKDGK